MGSNTMILITPDHGDMIGERGLWFKKNLFDQAIRVPMILRFPDESLPTRVASPVSLLDVLPTLMDAADIPESALVTEIEGKSLLKVAEGRYRDRPVYAEHLEGGTKAPRVMLRKGDLKMVHSLEYPTQLYNLAEDANELVNLAMTPDWKEVTATLLEEVNAVWNLKNLKQEIISNQRARQLLARSLGKGKKRFWEHYPNPHRDITGWVREGDYFPEVEQRGYLSYPKE